MDLKKFLPTGKADALCFFALGVTVLLFLLGALLFNLWLLLIALLPAAYAFFRLYSPALGARKRENAVFCRICLFPVEKVTALWRKLFLGKKETDKKKVRLCPDCGAKLCFEHKTGSFHITCPRCKCRFRVDLS